MSADAGVGQVKREAVSQILKAFANSDTAKVSGGVGGQAMGSVLIDTARIYQMGTPDADTETVLGQVLADDPSLRDVCSIATKCNPIMPPHKSLARQAVTEHLEESLAKLGTDSVDLFYLHMPDIHTDVDNTLDAIAELHENGKFKELGLSNYPAWKMVDIWHRCKQRGIVLPTVYQGMYNGITRDWEREVVPVLREFGMRAYMYNPLAGGLLTGRYSSISDLSNQTSGRFSSEFGKSFGAAFPAHKMYQARYSKDAFFDALLHLKQACDDNATTMPSVAVRWVLHHSLLSGTHGDGIIFGVSSVEQVNANLVASAEGPLPESIVEAFERAWDISRPACESYFRGYGAIPGGIEAHLALHA